MPVIKLCRNCPHIKTLHHITNGRNEGACSVAHCRCTGYGERPEKGDAGKEKCSTMPQDELSFVRWQIKQHKRMIHELQERHGISE